MAKEYSDEDLTQTRSFFHWIHENGEREILLRKARFLLHECGWIDEMKTYCIQVYQRSTHGFEDITIEELVLGMMRYGEPGRDIPDTVKSQLLDYIQILYTQFSRQQDVPRKHD